MNSILSMAPNVRGVDPPRLSSHAVQVKILGIVRTVDAKATKLTYTVEDHTGMCICALL